MVPAAAMTDVVGRLRHWAQERPHDPLLVTDGRSYAYDEALARAEAVADALLKYETLDGEEVKQIIAGKTLDRPTVGELLEAETRKSADKPDQTKSQQEPELKPDDFGGAMPQPG